MIPTTRPWMVMCTLVLAEQQAVQMKVKIIGTEAQTLNHDHPSKMF
jgi:hypothetical protein